MTVNIFWVRAALLKRDALFKRDDWPQILCVPQATNHYSKNRSCQEADEYMEVADKIFACRSLLLSVFLCIRPILRFVHAMLAFVKSSYVQCSTSVASSCPIGYNSSAHCIEYSFLQSWPRRSRFRSLSLIFSRRRLQSAAGYWWLSVSPLHSCNVSQPLNCLHHRVTPSF